MTEGRVVREEDRAQDGDGRNGRTEIASMKRESGMYGRLTMVCGSVRSRLKRSDSLYMIPKKSFRFGKKFQMKLFLVSYICLIERTSVFVVVVP